MTRFLMPLAHAVDLVEYAFMHGRDGDTFVRRSPAATMGDLATAVQELFNAQVGVRRIGVRHGEKLYETLATAHELRQAEDMGDYYRIAMDTRDLDYAKFFSEGDEHELEVEDFHSHNAPRLDVPEIVGLLRTLPEIQRMFAARQ